MAWLQYRLSGGLGPAVIALALCLHCPFGVEQFWGGKQTPRLEVPSVEYRADVSSREVSDLYQLLVDCTEKGVALPGVVLDMILGHKAFYSDPPATSQAHAEMTQILQEINHIYPEIPNIVHVIYQFYPDNSSFSFVKAMSLLSMHKYIRPDRIIFWYDTLPHGYWWNYVTKRISYIVPIYRQRSSTIFGKAAMCGRHSADIARFEILLRYGGEYTSSSQDTSNCFVAALSASVVGIINLH